MNLCVLAELSSLRHLPQRNYFSLLFTFVFFFSLPSTNQVQFLGHPVVNLRSGEVYNQANSPIVTHYSLQSCVLLPFLVLSRKRRMTSCKYVTRKSAFAFKQTGIAEAQVVKTPQKSVKNQCSRGVTQELLLPSRLMDVRCVFV